jgi:exonuclease III
VLLASRFPLKVADPQLVSVPWQERLLSATVSTPSGAIEVCTIYVPTGSGNGPVKVETLEGLYDHLAKEAHHHRILCGDFNTPQRELESGEVVTFGQRIRSDGTVRTRSRVHGTDGRRWDEAERNVIRGLEKFDLPDVFRSVHGFGRKEASWFSFGGKKKRGFRLDHIFASRRLRPSEIYYDHAPRKDNLSDHSPLIASFYAAKGTTGGEVNRGFCADCGPPPLFSRVAMAPGDLLCGSATRFYRLENST